MRTAQIRIINEVVPIIIEEDMIKKKKKGFRGMQE